MISNTERRNEDRGRIPFELAVELGHEGFDESFEADAVDLSPGGLSLRTACLPDIGEELLCRFEAMPGGTQVSSRGRVVWTQTKGDRSGEFGLRFTDIDDESKALIDELVAERKARLQAQQAEAFKVAELQLAGVGAPLTARLLRSGGGEAVFEQTLPLLELGRGVVARAGHVLGKGSIAEVKLSMQGGTPTLAVTVRFDDRRSLFGEFEWEKPVLDVDTVPDLDAPSAEPERVAEPTLRASEPQPAARVTMVEFETSPTTDSEAGAMPAALTTAEEEPLQASRTEAVDDEDDDGDYEGDDVDDDAPMTALPSDTSANLPRVVVAPGLSARVATAPEAPVRPRIAAIDEEGHEPWAHPVPDAARSSALVRLLRVLVAIGSALGGASAAVTKLCGPGARKLTLQTKAFVTTRAWPGARDAVTGLLSKASARPRRVTTAPAAMQKAESVDRNLLRTVAIVGSAVCAVALSVYALAPSPADSAIELHRPVRAHGHAKAHPLAAQAPAPVAATELVDTAATTGGAPMVAAPVTVSAQGKVNAAYASAMAGQPLTAAVPQIKHVVTPAPATPTAARASTPSAPAVPAAGTVPAASPYAIDVREGSRGAAAPKAVSTTQVGSFGQRSVDHAQRFVLRMSGPIKAFQGTGDKTGFTVTAQGATSLDKAGPIAASNKNVARAAIWNKNGQAELTVRFADGKSPAYRVVARGAELEILIAQ